MGKARSVVVHLALVFTGWAVAILLTPRLFPVESDGSRELPNLPAKTDRPRLDGSGGQRLIARLMPQREPGDNGRWPGWDVTSIKERMRIVRAGQGQPPLSEEESKRNAGVFMLTDVGNIIIHGVNGPSIGYAFRHGRLGAIEIRKMIVTQFPEHAGLPYFDEILCKTLASYNPVGVEPLLEVLPPKVAAEVRKNILANGFGEIRPADYHAFIASCLSKEGVADLDLQSTWDHAMVFNYLPEFATGLTGWVESLPPGVQRDAALESLAKRYHASNPVESGRLRKLRTEQSATEGP